MSIGITPYAYNAYKANQLPPRISRDTVIDAAELGIEIRKSNFDLFECVGIRNRFAGLGTVESMMERFNDFSDGAREFWAVDQNIIDHNNAIRGNTPWNASEWNMFVRQIELVRTNMVQSAIMHLQVDFARHLFGDNPSENLFTGLEKLDCFLERYVHLRDEMHRVLGDNPEALEVALAGLSTDVWSAMFNNLDNYFGDCTTIESAMERYAELYAKVSRVLGNDSKGLDDFGNHLHSQLYMQVSHLLGAPTQWTSQNLDDYQPHRVAADALTRGFVDAIKAGKSLEDAKLAAFERATSELERLMEMYEKMLENEDAIRANHWVNPKFAHLSRFSGLVDKKLDMYRDAITVSAMILALLRGEKDN
jgi:hypothetical protein